MRAPRLTSALNTSRVLLHHQYEFGARASSPSESRGAMKLDSDEVFEPFQSENPPLRPVRSHAAT